MIPVHIVIEQMFHRRKSLKWHVRNKNPKMSLDTPRFYLALDQISRCEGLKPVSLVQDDDEGS